MIRKKTIKKILVPLDGSKNSLRGLDEAIYIARQSQAMLFGLHVIPVYPRNFTDAIIPYQLFQEKEAKKFITLAKTKCAKQGVLFKGKIVYGSPVVEISHLAKNKKFDMIVIGSRGMGGIKEMFLGSVAKSLVHSSKVPVLVVK